MIARQYYSASKSNNCINFPTSFSRKCSNQFAHIYKFFDGSSFIVYKTSKPMVAYRSNSGYIMAVASIKT